MITRSYDVIVAGFRPGGLLAGTILAKHGLRVLAINQDGRGPFNVGKYTFPSHRYPFIGFDDRELLGGAIDNLMIHPNERRLIQPSVPSYQVILPHQRVDVYPDEAFFAEIDREFPHDGAIFSSLYERIRDEAGTFIQAWHAKRAQPPTPSLMQKMGMRSAGRRERRLFPSSTPLLSELLDMMDASAEVRAFIGAQIIAFGYSTEPESIPLPIASHLLTSARCGIFGNRKSAEPLVGLLTERLRTLQSDVVPQERITSLEFSWGKLQEVRFQGYDHAFNCEYLIWNAPFDELLNVLPETVRPKGYDEWPSKPAFERYSIHVALDEFVIPVGMHDNVIIVGDPEAPLQEGNFVYVTMSPEGSEAFAPPGSRALTVTTVIPSGPEFQTRETRREVATRMLTNLKRVVPFMERYVRTLHIPMPADELEVGDPVYRSTDITRRFSGDIGPGPGLPHWNVFHVGRESYPLLGFEGEVGAGILAADAVLATRRG